MPGLQKPLLLSSLASAILHGALIVGFSFNSGSDLSQYAGVSRLNVQLKPLDIAHEPVIDSPDSSKPLSEAVSRAKDQEKVLESKPDSGFIKNKPEQTSVISSHKSLKEKPLKKEVTEPEINRAELQDQPKKSQQPDTAKALNEVDSGKKEQAQASSPSPSHPPSSPAKSTNKVDPIELWLAELQQRINQYRHYPRQAIKRRLEGDVRVKAVINPDGSLVDAEVLSGDRRFHSSSLRSLRQALPFTPPAGTSQPVTIVFTIHYKLE